MSSLENGAKRRRSRRSVEQPVYEEDCIFQNDDNDPEATLSSSPDSSTDEEPQIQKRSSRRSVKRVKYAELAGVVENQVLDDDTNEKENGKMEKRQQKHDLREKKLFFVKRQKGTPAGIDLGENGKNLEIIDARDMDAGAGFQNNTNIFIVCVKPIQRTKI